MIHMERQTRGNPSTEFTYLKGNLKEERRGQMGRDAVLIGTPYTLHARWRKASGGYIAIPRASHGRELSVTYETSVAAATKVPERDRVVRDYWVRATATRRAVEAYMPNPNTECGHSIFTGGELGNTKRGDPDSRETVRAGPTPGRSARRGENPGKDAAISKFQRSVHPRPATRIYCGGIDLETARSRRTGSGTIRGDAKSATGGREDAGRFERVAAVQQLDGATSKSKILFFAGSSILGVSRSECSVARVLLKSHGSLICSGDASIWRSRRFSLLLRRRRSRATEIPGGRDESFPKLFRALLIAVGDVQWSQLYVHPWLVFFLRIASIARCMRHELTKSKSMWIASAFGSSRVIGRRARERAGAERWRTGDAPVPVSESPPRGCGYEFEADDRPGGILREKHNATTAVSVASIFLDWERAGREVSGPLQGSSVSNQSHYSVYDGGWLYVWFIWVPK
ncbi:hypothetical protein DFH09DRAFT_1282670 [Mycena vulgaris]|nr:hypothetical protein DFH09DRAFT_1282670 [Mycena vulgaris]